MAQAAARIREHRTIEALLRQQVHMFGQTIIGKGAYRQSRRGSNLLVRMDLQLQLDDRAATFQQISDGRFLWTFQDSPDIHRLGAFEQQLSRVDLDIVRRAQPVPGKRRNVINPSSGTLGQGGLSQFVGQLVQNFTFDVPQSGTLHDVPVWTVTGEWQESALRSILDRYQDTKDTMEDDRASQTLAELLKSLPSQFPHTVNLVLGKDDLFPYRIGYRQIVNAESGAQIVVTSTTRPMLTLELFQVMFDAPIDPSYFIREPGDLPVRDATSAYLEAHGLQYRQTRPPHDGRAARIP